VSWLTNACGNQQTVRWEPESDDGVRLSAPGRSAERYSQEIIMATQRLDWRPDGGIVAFAAEDDALPEYDLPPEATRIQNGREAGVPRDTDR
jgi:hypothetical protein